MTEMTIAGETFNVLVEGDETKPVLMISNPLGVDLHLWDPLMPALLEHFRVVRYDSRGHGASIAHEGPYSIADLGKDAVAIMDALGLDKVHWLGLSKGAMVGQWLLIHARERIGRAVLANTAAQVAGPDLWNERIQTARETGMEAVAEIVADRWFTKTFREADPDAVEAVLELLRRTPLHGYVAAAAAIRDMDQREAIRSIANPVLVIVGRHDPSAPPGLGALVASSIEGAELVTLDASHMSNIEDAESFTKAAVDFLTAVEAPARETPLRRRSPSGKAPVKKTAAKTAPGKKVAAKKAPAATAPAKKAAVKKAATKKTAAKKSPAKKAPAKKIAAKTASVSRTPAKKAPARKMPPKKTLARKAPAKKAASKKIPTKKVAAKKAPAKKKMSSRKSIVKKAAPKKGAGRRRT